MVSYRLALASRPKVPGHKCGEPQGTQCELLCAGLSPIQTQTLGTCWALRGGPQKTVLETVPAAKLRMAWSPPLLVPSYRELYNLVGRTYTDPYNPKDLSDNS